jgi:hypothetical protein
VSRSDVLLVHIHQLRLALAGVRAARTKCAALGSAEENLRRIAKLEAMVVELEDTLRELRRSLHLVGREERA